MAKYTQGPLNYTGKTRLHNLKHERITQDVLAGKKPAKAYQRQFPDSNTSSAHTSVARVLNAPATQRRIDHLLNEAGLTDAIIINKMRTLIEAEEPLTHNGMLTGDTKPALAIQSDMLKTALKLKGLLSDKPNINTNIQLNKNDYNEYKLILDKVNAPKPEKSPQKKDLNV